MFAAIEYLLLAIILFLAAGSLLNLSSHPHRFIRGWDFPRVQIIVIGWLAVLLYFAFRSLAGGSSSFSSWWLLGPAIALTLCHGFPNPSPHPHFPKASESEHSVVSKAVHKTFGACTRFHVARLGDDSDAALPETIL